MGLFRRKQPDASGSEKPSSTGGWGKLRILVRALRSLFRSSSSPPPKVAPPPPEAAPLPAHQEATSAPPTEPLAPAQNATTPNTPLGTTDYSGLSKVDTLFIIDDSISMSGSNWDQTSAALAAIVPTCTAHDSDGVEVHFLNHEKSYSAIRTSEELLRLLGEVKPSGATPTGRKLSEILERYVKLYRQNKSIKPLNIIIITDGEPSDPSKLEKCIVECAKQLDRVKAPNRQVGVQFFQVGNDDAATESLEALDNALAEESGTRDMVDTVSWKKMKDGKGLTADAILKVVMGAMDKTLDGARR